MSNRSCSFPEHHGKSGGSGLLAAVAVLAVAAYLVIRLALVVVRFIETWWWVPVPGLIAVAAAWLAARKIRNGVSDLPASRSARRARISVPWLRHLPRAAWAALRWHHLTRNLGLAYPDKHRKGKIRRPRAVILPGRHGVVARVRTVPGSARQEFDEASQHISDYWRVSRVSVSQPKPGRLVVRGLKRDPLLEVLHLPVVNPPRGGQFATPECNSAPRRLYLGRDERGADRFADLANVPGICVGGQPGGGKSTEVTSWQVQLAPSPAVQFVNLDGKGADEYRDFEPRAWLTGGDDLDEALGILETVHGLMADRLACVRDVLGTKNAWHAGPSEAWPLVVTTIDECQQYFDLTMVKGDKQAEPKVRRMIFLTSSLVRRGRSVAMLTLSCTQKPTTDSLPSSIRDNCPVSLCFPVKTLDAAAACLGSEIRKYDSYSPAGLPTPGYTGVATVTLATGRDPFTRLRGPWVTEVQAAAVAVASAHLRKDPRALLPVAVPDDARELVP